MRRTMWVLTVMATTLVLASGVALAVTKIGGPGEDTLVGTNNRDLLDGRGGDDPSTARAATTVLLAPTSSS